MTATDVLKKDHNAVKKLFTQFNRTTARAVEQRQHLVDKISEELEIHAAIEEELFYPAVRATGEGEDLVREAVEEHQEVKQLVAEIQGLDVSSPEIADQMRQLREAVLHHATEEEKEMFPFAKEHLGAEELTRLGQQLQARKEELKGSLAHRAQRTIKKGIRKIA